MTLPEELEQAELVPCSDDDEPGDAVFGIILGLLLSVLLWLLIIEAWRLL